MAAGDVPVALDGLERPEDALPVLDEYEGDEYRRVRVTLPDGQVCWTYVWTAAVGGMPVLAGGWTGRDRSGAGPSTPVGG